MKKAAGFTLIETLIVVAIIGILASIAVPSYSDYLTRAKIPDATSALATKFLQLEQYFQDNQTYVDAPACVSDAVTSRYFTFSCSSSTAGAFTLQAVGRDAMSGFTYTIDNSNAKATAALPDGWTAHSPNNCWVNARGGLC